MALHKSASFDTSQFVCEYCEQSFNDCRCDEFFENEGEDEGVIYETYPAEYFLGRLPSPQLQQDEPVTCKFFLSGNCKNGNSCRFSHGSSSKIQTNSSREVCKYFKSGNCRNGNSCPYSHQQSEETLDPQIEMRQLDKEIELLRQQLAQKETRKAQLFQILYANH